MPTEKKLTGYPSIDKPWLKYYTEEEINAETPKCSIYQKIYENNLHFTNQTALLFFGKKITYKKLFSQIDRTAIALASYGVVNGDNVAICMPALPETVYAILALNKIGANAVLLNPLFDEQQLLNRINETEAKLLFVANELYGRIKNILPKTKIETIISCSAVNSLGAVVKTIKKVKTIEGTITWDNFIKNNNCVGVKVPSNEPNKPALMVYSSGTTGQSKGIQLTNDGVLTLLVDAKSVFVEMKRQDRYFVQIPLWFSTGLVATLLTSLYYGLVAILEPLYDLSLFSKHIAKFKPNYMITATGLVDYLYYQQYNHPSYKHFKCLAIGGEYVTPQAEKRFNKWLADNGNNIPLQKGYGMCELGSIVTAASVRYNTIGSAGIPTPHVVVSAFNAETNEELRYGERGEIRVCSPCKMLGYYKNKQATNDFFFTDKNRNVWACTGDMGYVAEDGNVYVDGRISSSYKNEANETIYLFDIERAILAVEQVRQCKVVMSKNDNKKTHVAHIVLIDDADKNATLNAIKEHCESKLPANHVPTLIKLYDTALPVAPSGKLNVAQMESDTNDLIRL
ncbi:MAG: acyl--CoA ligase [Ruminococcus sp.]|nr:acyl--CoA ligase [Ruminococcus sp.]